METAPSRPVAEQQQSAGKVVAKAATEKPGEKASGQPKAVAAIPKPAAKVDLATTGTQEIGQSKDVVAVPKAAIKADPVTPKQSTAKSKDVAPPQSQPQKAPSALNLASLETRLKETKAIGVLSKLSLKNQVDDLLDLFRAFYQGELKTTLVQLRLRYDLLLMKILTLIQDRDQALAKAIAASREAVWALLADRKSFAALN